MMIMISGYQLVDELYKSNNSHIYRAYRQTDNQSVILKVLQPAYPPPPEQIARFQREYKILNELKELPNIITVYDLVTEQNYWVMVLEDFGAQSLERLNLAGQLSVTHFLQLAIQLVVIISQLHQRYLIHKDINPANILLNPTTQQIKLIDFGISTKLSRENTTFRNPNLLEGTLAYLSPEQTGRMNRAIDYRTDFYSLGVTFYELLTGQLPFATDDVLELVHCHLAKVPMPPHQVQPDIPPVLADIILKLMAKNAEDRYQSATGLKADLENCLQQWQQQSEIMDFPLGAADVSERFDIPQKLYGRAVEIATLTAAIERVSQGKSELMLVAGYAGIGKSALIQEIYKPLTHRRGYFIAGKFDQLQRHIPYAAFLQAFRQLMGYLLTESEVKLTQWRQRLLAALGNNGQIIIEVLPELEQIIGSQPPISTLGSVEAQNRFNLLLQNFIQVFTQPEHPLVIFLDDLQWADSASLKLIKLLMIELNSHYLLFIGAYRDNEVSATHPLRLTLAELNQAQVTINSITLSPLKLPDLNQLVTETLHCQPSVAKPLAELIQGKTDGNPFFVNEFLKSLHTDNLLTFNYEYGHWQWQLEQIQAQQITDNVVELMASKVQKLPAATVNLLKLAACLGNQFDLARIAIVAEQPAWQVATALRAALIDGLIIPLNETYRLMELEIVGLAEQVVAVYKFAHDRIQQAVYSLIPPIERQVVHWQLGQLLLQHTSPATLEQNLFEITNQLNQGYQRIETDTKRTQLAQLNLQAGKKAKLSAAYNSAFEYLNQGLKLLPSHSWQQEYQLTLALFVEAAEAAYLMGHFEDMERLLETILATSHNLIDKAKAYEIRIQAYTARTHFLAAVETGLQVLELLGIHFPKQPSPADVTEAIQATQSRLESITVSELIKLPAMTDPIPLAAIQMMTSLINATYIAMYQLMPLMICQQVNLSMDYGNAPESACAYANYSFLIANIGHIDLAYQLSQLAVQVVEHFDTKRFKANTYLFCGFVRHLKEPLAAIIPAYFEAYQSGQETGDFTAAANAAESAVIIKYYLGMPLMEVEQEMSKYGQAIAQMKQEMTLQWLKIHWQAVLNLQGKSAIPYILSGEVYDEAVMEPLHIETNNNSSLMFLYTQKMTLCYQFYQFKIALLTAIKLESCIVNAATTFFAPPAYFYDSLTRLAVFEEASPEEQQQISEKVSANQANMKKWAEHAPMNYLHKFYLIKAEQARVLEQYGEAREYYEQAIVTAHKHGYLHEEALAYELAGRFYLHRNQNQLARCCLQEAHYAYQRWGALAKVKDLEQRYSQYLELNGPIATQWTKTTTRLSTTTGQTQSSVLDLAAVLKASQTLAGEIVLSQLLQKLMKTVIENAGAQIGFLILDKHKKGTWAIEAKAVLSTESLEQQTHNIEVSSSLPFEQSEELAISIIHYVLRSHQMVILTDATMIDPFAHDAYLQRVQPKSILCLPLLNQGQLNGILYLENQVARGAFTAERVEVLNLLSSQIAISIENAYLYNNLEEKVQERTQTIAAQKAELEVTLHQLRTTQAQLVESEKMAALGNLVAGVAHEINTPVGVGVTAASQLDKLTKDFANLYKEGKMTRTDLEKYLNSAHQSSVLLLRNLTRAAELTKSFKQVAVDQSSEQQRTFALKEYLSEIITSLRPEFKNTSHQIEVNCPAEIKLSSYPGALSQIITNLVINSMRHGFQQCAAGLITIEVTIETGPALVEKSAQRLVLHYSDNGKGISPDIIDKIFQPFFTTNRQAGGTGLGLHIVYNLVTHKLKGTIRCESVEGLGSTFTIDIPTNT
ncbi:serine/threonine protein kinase [Thioploca ingrica]|uniref:histidine kinase n=1 Tax=Thioploca ingrica TaxID=40754 RepID=A0A090APA5_9GAMM|nr:serine/threonine protein kinase [Thioploca ingrica]